MELQAHRDELQRRGLGLAAISYDSVDTLKHFAQRQGITFPLLSDSDSSVIRAFGILNPEVPAGTPFAGIPYPGTYILDTEGRVVSKFFEDDFRERFTTSEILVRQYGAAAGSAHKTVETKHLIVSSAASADTVRPGQRIALTLDIEMKPSMHVYAPGVTGYIPIDWAMKAGSEYSAHPVEFPKSKMLRLDAIDETVPVYDGHLRLLRDITVSEAAAGTITVSGTLRYQACDDRTCYIPQTVPLDWVIRVESLDKQRVPAALQRKVK